MGGMVFCTSQGGADIKLDWEIGMSGMLKSCCIIIRENL